MRIASHFVVTGVFCFVCVLALYIRCAFLHFCSVKRPKLKQENPSLSVGAMARQLSSAWKLMTPEQKKPYDEMAERDKLRYARREERGRSGVGIGMYESERW